MPEIAGLVLWGLAGHLVWSARLRAGWLVADGDDVVNERVHVYQPCVGL